MKRCIYVLVCITITIFLGCLICYQPVKAMDTDEINLGLIVSDEVKMQKKVEVKCLDQTNDKNVIFENKDYKFGAFFHPNSVRIRHWKKIKDNNNKED